MSETIEDRPEFTFNRRHLWSMQLLGAVMQVVDKYICDHADRNYHRDCARELCDLFDSRGVQIITEEQRLAAGLAPRDENGMTEDELVVMEANILQAMRTPAPPIFT